MKRALQAGSRLHGTYQINKVVGSGGFGLTYEGLDLRTMTLVCIKELFISKLSVRNGDGSVVVTPGGEDKEFYLERFQREAKTLATIQHDHVVSVKDMFEDNGTAYFVMEFVEGENLSQMVKRMGRPLDEGQFKHVFSQVLSAVKAVHAKNLVHRDIKPSNIMLEPGFRVKLIDFGAVKDSKLQAASGHTVVVTDGFAPIEQYSSQGQLGKSSDVYSIGASMLFAVTGQRPDPATARDGDPSLEVVKDEKLRSLIGKLMEVNAEDRPQTIAQVEKLFNATFEGKQDPERTRIEKRKVSPASKSSELPKPSGVSSKPPKSSPKQTSTPPSLGFWEAYGQGWKKYADFSGRARRLEYWSFTLVNGILPFLFLMVAAASAGVNAVSDDVFVGSFSVAVFLWFAFTLVTLVPSLAVAVRRLHDSGHSGAWFLVSVVPYLGGLIFLVFMLLDSEEDNKWGPCPK